MSRILVLALATLALAACSSKVDVVKPAEMAAMKKVAVISVVAPVVLNNFEGEGGGLGAAMSIFKKAGGDAPATPVDMSKLVDHASDAFAAALSKRTSIQVVSKGEMLRSGPYQSFAAKAQTLYDNLGLKALVGATTQVIQNEPNMQGQMLVSGCTALCREVDHAYVDQMPGEMAKLIAAEGWDGVVVINISLGYAGSGVMGSMAGTGDAKGAAMYNFVFFDKKGEAAAVSKPKKDAYSKSDKITSIVLGEATLTQDTQDAIMEAVDKNADFWAELTAKAL